MNRRELLRHGAGLFAACTASSGHAQGSAFPDKPIRLVAASSPGTLVDEAARLYADRMAVYLKQPILVENVAGASTTIAARQVIKSAPDGHTLMVAANTVVVAPLVIRNAGYALKDFTAIGEMARAPGLLVVSGASPFRTLRDLVAAAKARPEAISYASSGIGSTNHLAVEILAREAGVAFTHVPYKGISAAVPDVVSGRVTFAMPTATSVAGVMATGGLRALAISSDARSAAFPDVPTLRESGYANATSDVWIGMVGPAGIPPAVLARLAAALEAARQDQALLKRLNDAGQVVSNVRSAEQFMAVLRREEEQARRIVNEKRISLE